MPEPFFVVGCGRSGTTLLRSMLIRHSRIEIPGETHFVPYVLRASFLLDRGPLCSPAVYSKVFSANRRLALSGISANQIERYLEQNGIRTTKRAVEAIYELYAELNEAALNSDPSVRVLGDKTPSYVRHIPLLSSEFPTSKFIHIIRDGRNVAQSLVQMPWGPKTIPGALDHWERRVRIGRKAGKKLGDRYVELRYEDLVDDPQGQLIRICEALNLSFEPSMLESTTAQDLSIQNFHPETHRNVSKALRASSYQQEIALSSSQRALLIECGYEALDMRTPSKRSQLFGILDSRASTIPISRARLRTAGRLISQKNSGS